MKTSWIVIGLVGFVTVLVLKTVGDAGEFRSIVEYGNEDCYRIEGLPGPEDIEAVTNHMLISSDPRERWGLAAGKMMDVAEEELIAKLGREDQGNIFVIDSVGVDTTPTKLNLVGYYTDEPNPIRVGAADTKDRLDFHPHGIGVWTGEAQGQANVRRVFVVNHRRDGDAVEVFDWNEATGDLVYFGSVQGDLLRNLNDVAPDSPTSFYVTIWRYYSPNNKMSLVESYLKQPWSYVAHCRLDTATLEWSCRKVADGIKMANGVALAPNQRSLFVMALLERGVRIYDIAPDGSGDLVNGYHSQFLDLQTMGDNLSFAPDGSLWVGCHPKLLTFVHYAEDPANRIAPSQVMRLVPPDNGYPIVEEPRHSQIFLSNGEDISASSVAAPFPDGKRYIIGSVFGDHALVCRKPDDDEKLHLWFNR